jgi:hypothetical protein
MGSRRDSPLVEIVAEVVEKEERIEVCRFSESEGTLELDTGTFDGGFCVDYSFDRPDGHDRSSCM